jgi:hypothetical protein
MSAAVAGPSHLGPSRYLRPSATTLVSCPRPQLAATTAVSGAVIPLYVLVPGQSAALHLDLQHM